MNEAKISGKVKPWTFIPLLYFMQAIPVALVQEVSSIIFKDFGIANESILQWTSLIAIPWSLQMLLGPLVDLNGTKRRWILGGQLLMAVGLMLAPFAFGLPNAFQICLAIFFFIAVFSALCNTATDGFYLLAMPADKQAAFAGVQTTSYRLGRLFCTGILVMMAGILHHRGLENRVAWGIVILAAGLIYLLGYFINRSTVPAPIEDHAAAEETPGENKRNITRTLNVVILGFTGYFAASALWRLGAHALWKMLDGNPTGYLKGWMLGDRGLYGPFDFGLNGVTAEVVQFIVCGLLTTYAFIAAKRTIVGTPMGDAFGSYFRQPGIVAIMSFLLFYRFGEVMVSRMSPLFLKDAVEKGGLGISNEVLGGIKGVAGVLGIVCGGILGGLVISKLGLRRAFWPLVITMHTPNLLYVWAAMTHPPVIAMYGVDFVDQFGYGFGYAGYMIFLMQVAKRGNFPTSHYAIGVGLGALFISLAGILSGIIQSNFGYQTFFVSVIFLTIPGMLTLLFIPLDKTETA